MSTRNFHEDATLAGPASPEVDAVVTRFWSERGQGKPVSVDEVLETVQGVPDYAQTRATAIRLIASQAAAVSGAVEMPETQRATMATTIGAASQKLARHGPVPQIDGYDLVACLGAGGMGAVYEGYQSATGRRVAVKFMLDSMGGHESSRKRFEREVEVVARLQHPGIVSIIDSGVRKGKYFYVMEYVTGSMLDKAMPPGLCPPEAALRLIAGVCDAVDYAHQRGVLHRDLKPSNILVDEAGHPHLLDFGLAKVFDPAQSDGGSHGQMGLTISGEGSLLGTLAYMSPEQARGRHDETSVRTDVYALGAIAYELLTGRLPSLMAESLSVTLKRIIEEDPPAPSSIRKASSLGRDLDAVILRALEKDPSKRYHSAGDFAADLRRYLAGEPVEARRVSAAGRGWRWVRRNRAVSTVAAMALVALVSVSTILVAGIVRERDEARSTFDLLKGALESVDPQQLGRELTVVDLLDGASAKLDRTPPERRLTEAAVREILGNVYRNVGDYDRARAALEKAIAIREAETSGDSVELAEARHNLGAALWWEGKYAEAEAIYAQSLEMKRRLFRGDHPSIATTLTHLAACHLRRNRPAEARELYDQVLAMQQRLHGEESPEVAAAINNVAKCEMDAERYREAERLFRRALAMISKLRGSDSPGAASASQNLGDCLNRQSAAAALRGDSATAANAAAHAAAAFNHALTIRNRMFPRGHHLVAASLCGLARAELLGSDLDSALANARAGLEMLQRIRKPDHPDLSDGLEVFGLVLLARGDAPGAHAALTEAARIAAAAKPPAEGQLVSVRTALGRAEMELGRLDDAERHLSQALSTARVVRGERSHTATAAATALFELYTRKGEAQKAAEIRAIIESVTVSP